MLLCSTILKIPRQWTVRASVKRLIDYIRDIEKRLLRYVAEHGYYISIRFTNIMYNPNARSV